MARKRASQRCALDRRVHRGDGWCCGPNLGDGAGIGAVAGHGRRVPRRTALGGTGRRDHVDGDGGSRLGSRPARGRPLDEREGTARSVPAGARRRRGRRPAWARRLHVERKAHEWTDTDGAYCLTARMAPTPGLGSARPGRPTSIASSATRASSSRSTTWYRSRITARPTSSTPGASARITTISRPMEAGGSSASPANGTSSRRTTPTRPNPTCVRGGSPCRRASPRTGR